MILETEIDNYRERSKSQSRHASKERERSYISSNKQSRVIHREEKLRKKKEVNYSQISS